MDTESPRHPLGGKLTEVVYDSYRHQWTKPGELSYFGNVHRETFSGTLIKPYQEKKVEK